MPVMAITDGKGALDPFASAIVGAYCSYPGEDDPRREQLYSTVAAKILVDHPEDVDADVRQQLAFDLLPAVYASPEPDAIYRKAARFSANAWLAGDMLLFMLAAAIHHPEQRVNATKALWALCSMMEEPKIAERTAWKAWSTFKPVAHFRAVQQVWIQDADREEDLDVEGWIACVFQRFRPPIPRQSDQ